METNKKVSKGKFEDIQFRCHYLNKNYYKNLRLSKNGEI